MDIKKILKDVGTFFTEKKEGEDKSRGEKLLDVAGDTGETMLDGGSNYRPTINPAQITQNPMMQKNTIASDSICKVSYRVGDHKKKKKG